MNETEYREAEGRLWSFVGVEPAEQRVRLSDPDLEVRVQTVGEGPPVLFLHGGPNAGSTWAPIVPYLGGFKCLIVDRPGTGLSDPHVLTDDVHGFARSFPIQVLDGLGVNRAHVVASSFGGFLALMSAATHPDRFDRMVQMACPAFVPGMGTPGFMRGMSLSPVRWLMNRLPPNERVGKNILRQIGHGASIDADRIPQEFFDWYLALQRHTDTMRNDGEMIGRSASLRGFPPELTMPDEIFEAVATPTLFLWGEDDAFGGREVAEHVVGLMPDARLEMLPESGHLPWLDDPEKIGKETASFLGS